MVKLSCAQKIFLRHTLRGPYKQPFATGIRAKTVLAAWHHTAKSLVARKLVILSHNGNTYTATATEAGLLRMAQEGQYASW